MPQSGDNTIDEGRLYREHERNKRYYFDLQEQRAILEKKTRELMREIRNAGMILESSQRQIDQIDRARFSIKGKG